MHNENTSITDNGEAQADLNVLWVPTNKVLARFKVERAQTLQVLLR